MLPYDAEVLFAAFAHLNRAILPAPIVLWLLAVGLLALAFRPQAWGSRAAGLVLGAHWVVVGAVWQLTHFAEINFPAPIYGGLFIAQGALLIFTGAVRGRLPLRFRPDVMGWAGLAIALHGLVLYPLIFGLLGHGWRGLPVAGAMPVPTVLFTLGMLLLVEGRTPWHLLVIPIAWAGIDGVTAWMIDIPEDYVLPAAALATLALAGWRSPPFRLRRAPARS